MTLNTEMSEGRKANGDGNSVTLSTLPNGAAVSTHLSPGYRDSKLRKHKFM